MDKLFEVFCRNTNNEKEMFLVEGLEVNEYKKTVSLTDRHNHGVDTSNDKPVIYNYKFNDLKFKVISIFKRYYMQGDYRNIDGNPFIYALKNKYGWKFDMTQEEIFHYIKKFLTVCNNIQQEYDTVIMVPSMHQINKRFMTVIAKQVKATNVVEDLFFKTKKADIWENIDVEAIENYCYRNYHPNVAMNRAETIMRNIQIDLNRMPGQYFSAGMMNKDYIKFIDNIVSLNNHYSVEDAMSLINNKRVLVLDDILSTGTTISGCVKEVIKYGPKKLNVITLLSKQFYE